MVVAHNGLSHYHFPSGLLQSLQQALNATLASSTFIPIEQECWNLWGVMTDEISGGDDVIITEIQCTMSVILMNHPETIPSPSHTGL